MRLLVRCIAHGPFDEAEGFLNLIEIHIMDNNFKWLIDMAERKNQELESILGYATDGVGKFACDPALTILYYNAGLAELVGTTRGKIEKEGFNSSLYIHPDDVVYVQEELGKMLGLGKPFEMRYRLKHLSNKYIWVKVKGIFTKELYQGIYPIVYLVFTDITNLVTINEKLTNAYEQIELENKRYKAITELVSETFFEYDSDTNNVILFGAKPNDDRIAPPTEENIARFLEAFGQEIDTVEIEIQLYNKNNILSWYNIKARGIQYTENKWKRIIGTTKNIQEQKDEEARRSEQEKKLIIQARYDSMTQILNRSAMQQAIEEQMRVQPCYLCAVLDVDNFKTINDTHGHVFGDEVLKYIAGKLQKNCRSQDITGRLGGDEFMILFCSAMSIAQAHNRLERLLKDIQKKNCILSLDTNISVSIGAILVMKPGLSFLDVYQHADSALYVAKNNGKNTYSLDIYD